MKHLFIVNPAAGKCDRSIQVKNHVESLFGGRGIDYEVQVSKGPGDCIRLAKEAAQTGEELRIYACGGDGTLNEVINGVVGHDNVAVTHFPSGSGNDFVKIFDHPEAFKSLERLLDCEEASFDLIECQTDDYLCYGANIVSMGLDARIGTEIGLYRRLPLVTGKGAYYISTAVNVCKGTHRHYDIAFDGKHISDEQTLVCICNGRWYGGSFNPCPDAEPDDGLFDVLIIKKVSLMQLAAAIAKYQAGQYAQLPHFIGHYRTREITISCASDNVINLDGEALRAETATFRLAPHRIRFFYPRGLEYHCRSQKSAAGTPPASCYI